MEDTRLIKDSRGVRVAGILFGVATHLSFAVTVVYLFRFLRDGVSRSTPDWLTRDILLALQFGVIHSLLLHPRVKARITRLLRREWYGLLFCLVTCACLGLIFLLWRSSPGGVWSLRGIPRTAMLVGFYCSWIALLYSLWLSVLGYQTGFTPWWHWLRNQTPPARSFQPRSLYRWIRHPVYLSFLGLIWFTPKMSWDHVVLTAVWSAYIFFGSYLKDERLAYFLGDTYRRYWATVPGYPLMFWGPLAVRSLPSPSQPSGSRSTPSASASTSETTVSGTPASHI